ncbi:Gfo/Idh/MocA family protein [Sphingosinicella terrae]|uniref:Gfo/Idh/MocA family protein n=1 Tax=Sphingosinicella terrae TaxID=2172047 RepID=UPI000E0E00F8|nr:Gfo/Idh/MocA family oxidoreductase [Sphingosinicella terrae]
MAYRIGVVGFGKIARDQHLPSIAADPDFELAAVATRAGDPELGIPWFENPAELFAAMAGGLDAVAICTPPTARHAIARDALKAGLHVLLEKPPAATLGEIEHLERVARECGRTLYAGWHSQHAAAVPAAAEILSGRKVSRISISWLEDVRKWHPGQEWIWEAGGFGVFDPGINALSIATRILPMPLFVRSAHLLVPANKQAPIAARLAFVGERLEAELDWRFADGEQWTIRVETAPGPIVELRDGGARLFVDGAEKPVGSNGEYPSIYASFAALIRAGRSEVDREPLRIVADAFLVAEREATEAFL